MTKLPMTAAGHAVLQDELRHRLRITRPNLAQRIQQAIADDANLVENAEFQAAQAEQELNEARIAELRSQLTLLPDCLEDWVSEENAVHVIDAFVEALDLHGM